MKISEKFSKILQNAQQDKERLNSDHLQSETVPAPLTSGITQDRVLASITYARSMKFLAELPVVFDVLRKEGRITPAQEEQVARALGWKKGFVEVLLGNEEISAGIGNLLSALASRIEGPSNSDHASEGERRVA